MPNEQMRPASKEKAPDPSNTYERSHPENESGMGHMDIAKAVPIDHPDALGSTGVHDHDAPPAPAKKT
jgi:hypothetical protein